MPLPVHFRIAPADPLTCRHEPTLGTVLAELFDEARRARATRIDVELASAGAATLVTVAGDGARCRRSHPSPGPRRSRLDGRRPRRRLPGRSRSPRPRYPRRNVALAHPRRAFLPRPGPSPCAHVRAPGRRRERPDRGRRRRPLAVRRRGDLRGRRARLGDPRRGRGRRPPSPPAGRPGRRVRPAPRLPRRRGARRALAGARLRRVRGTLPAALAPRTSTSTAASSPRGSPASPPSTAPPGRCAPTWTRVPDFALAQPACARSRRDALPRVGARRRPARPLPCARLALPPAAARPGRHGARGRGRRGHPGSPARAPALAPRGRRSGPPGRPGGAGRRSTTARW